MESFRKPSGDGWRYGLSYRTQRQSQRTGWWRVERWNGEEWEFVDHATSYADARAVATKDSERRAVTV